MRILILAVALMLLVSACGQRDPADAGSGACYHPTDGGMYDNKADCDKHNGTWG